MSPTDEELAERAKRGDQDAFAALVTAHEQRMYGLALRLLRDAEDAADAAQEAFMRCYAALHSYNSHSSFGAWLYRIAYNHCLDVLRQRRRAPVGGGAPERVERILLDAPDPGPSVEDLVERTLSAERVERGLDQLSDEHRGILTLRYTLNLSYKEIAHVLRVPESTVTMRLHHAKRALRAQLITAEEGADGSS